MVFHAKALEMYTLCFQNLDSISEEEDLEVNALYKVPINLSGNHVCSAQPNSVLYATSVGYNMKLNTITFVGIPELSSTSHSAGKTGNAEGLV